MADSREVRRRACVYCREIQYFLDGDDLRNCRKCGADKFGPATDAMRPYRGYELSNEDRAFLRVQRINPEED